MGRSNTFRTVFTSPTDNVAVNALMHQQAGEEVSMLPCRTTANF